MLISALLWGVSHAVSAWFVQTVDSAGNVGEFTSLALDSSGNPRVSYYDITNGDLKCAEWASSAWNIQTVDYTGNLGEYSSLALDASGYPCISYFDATNRDLKYANWTGSAWSIQTVDDAGGSLRPVGESTSLALDSNGYPCISYYEATNGDLKYAKWTGSAWSTQAVDELGDVGMYSSLALDSSGYAHISYCDGTIGDLKYAFGQGEVIPEFRSVVLMIIVTLMAVLIKKKFRANLTSTRHT